MTKLDSAEKIFFPASSRVPSFTPYPRTWGIEGSGRLRDESRPKTTNLGVAEEAPGISRAFLVIANCRYLAECEKKNIVLCSVWGASFFRQRGMCYKKTSSLWSFHPTNIEYLRLTAINSTGLLFTNTFRSFSRGIKQEFRDYRARRPLSLLLSNFPVRPSSLSPLMIEAPRPVSEGREREGRGRRRSSARPKGTSNIILLAPLLSVRRLMLGGIEGGGCRNAHKS